MYDSLDMPALTFQAFNRFVMIDAEVGSTVQDVQRHCAEILSHNKRGDKEKVQIKTQVLMNCFAFITEEISPKHLSFSALISSFDGRSVVYRNDDQLRELNERILKTMISQSRIESTLESIKKKLTVKLLSIFLKLLKMAQFWKDLRRSKSSTRFD